MEISALKRSSYLDEATALDHTIPTAQKKLSEVRMVVPLGFWPLDWRLTSDYLIRK
jgi:hypothetical protein